MYIHAFSDDVKTNFYRKRMHLLGDQVQFSVSKYQSYLLQLKAISARNMLCLLSMSI
jgi:hypothetical protein